MILRLDEPSSMAGFVEYLTQRGFLVRIADQGRLDVQPLNRVSARYDAATLARAVEDWLREHPDAQVEGTV